MSDQPEFHIGGFTADEVVENDGPKATCTECKRAVVVPEEADGLMVFPDPVEEGNYAGAYMHPDGTPCDFGIGAWT